MGVNARVAEWARPTRADGRNRKLVAVAVVLGAQKQIRGSPDSAEEMNRLRAPLIRLHIERRPLRTSSIFLKRRYAAVGPPDEDDRPRPVAAARKEAVRDDARERVDLCVRSCW